MSVLRLVVVCGLLATLCAVGRLAGSEDTETMEDPLVATIGRYAEFAKSAQGLKGAKALIALEEFLREEVGARPVQPVVQDRWMIYAHVWMDSRVAEDGTRTWVVLDTEKGKVLLESSTDFTFEVIGDDSARLLDGKSERVEGRVEAVAVVQGERVVVCYPDDMVLIGRKRGK